MPKECFVPRSGPPEVLALRDVPEVTCGPEELRIQVAFAGVNFADLAVRAGLYGPAPRPPVVPGFELSGTVVEAGAHSGFAVGDRVLGVTRFGGYTEERVVHASRARKLPPSLSFEDAAALPAQYLTAYHALTEVCRVRKGESVLIHAAAGGVGTAAVQLCRALSLRSFGTASTDEKLQFARAQGLEHGINYAREDFEAAIARLTDGHGVDVVLDANGGASYGKSYRCLARGGRLVIYGAAAALPSSLRAIREWPKTAVEFLRQKWFHPFELIGRNVSVCGLQLLLLWDDLEVLGPELDALLGMAARSEIRPHVDRVFPLAEAAEAHRYLHQRRTRGKVLLAATRDTP